MGSQSIQKVTEEIIKKEEGISDVGRISNLIVSLVAIALSIFILWINTFGLMLAIKRNTLYMGLTLALIFMIYPAGKRKITVLDWTWAVIGLAVGLYTFFFYEPRVTVGTDPTMIDYSFAALS